MECMNENITFDTNFAKTNTTLAKTKKVERISSISTFHRHKPINQGSDRIKNYEYIRQ